MVEPGEGGLLEGVPIGFLDETSSHQKSVHKIGASVRFKPESVQTIYPPAGPSAHVRRLRPPAHIRQRESELLASIHNSRDTPC